MISKSKGAATERGTWTADDRQAWNDAYRAAICIAARRTTADTYRLSLLARRKNARAALVAYEGCSEDGTCDSFTLYGSCDHSVLTLTLDGCNAQVSRQSGSDSR